MELVANALNNCYLQHCLPQENNDVDGVYAAISYGSEFPNAAYGLISNCLRFGHRLDIWMRYDHTVPVSIPLLKSILLNHGNNVFCRLVPDCLHTKVIWWKGYGAYIGSANHTDRAWFRNIEAGIFLDENDLQSSAMAIELEGFFNELSQLDRAFPLTSEIVKEMEKIQQERTGFDERGKEFRTHPIWQGPNFQPEKTTTDRRKDNFRQEWNETLTILRSISNALIDNRPVWVDQSTPLGWQTDQFLHAFYYNVVSDGNRKPFEEFYQKNKRNPNDALEKAIDWWTKTDSPPSNEDIAFNTSAPYIKNRLQQNHILDITRDEFALICYYTHATKDHVIKLNLKMFGVVDKASLPTEERTRLFSDWLLGQRNEKDWDVKQLLNFVLYTGPDDKLWNRLYLAGKAEEYRIPHYGLNSIAEVVGWTRPDIAPPRNGRTSKALRALGFDVQIY